MFLNKKSPRNLPKLGGAYNIISLYILHLWWNDTILKIFRMGWFNHQAIPKKTSQNESSILNEENLPLLKTIAGVPKKTSKKALIHPASKKVLRASWSTPCSKAPISPPGKVSSGRRRPIPRWLMWCVGGENRVMATQIGGNFFLKKKIYGGKVTKKSFWDYRFVLV